MYVENLDLKRGIPMFQKLKEKIPTNLKIKFNYKNI